MSPDRLPVSLQFLLAALLLFILGGLVGKVRPSCSACPTGSGPGQEWLRRRPRSVAG